MSDTDPKLRVGAHVLVQLGSELVTDVEQAILECVKNSYDADSPGCSIEISTTETDVRVETGPAEKLRRFTEPSETVEVAICDTSGKPIKTADSVGDKKVIQRRLKYKGRITIEDHGTGLTPEQLESSWLVISQSSKRSDKGQKKQKTKGGRTPLGDKGVGRLGSMRLGDILLIESATSRTTPLATAQFRWTDCETAETVDQIPVFTEIHDNIKKFKGTRVSVLGLRDLSEWQRKEKAFEIARSLAKLISPFETTSTFPVGISHDGVDLSLVTITDEALKQAVAQFTFSFEVDEKTGVSMLVAEARFKKKLFTSTRSKKAKERTDLVFGVDEGEGFIDYLENYPRLKAFDKLKVNPTGSWFITIKSAIPWEQIHAIDGQVKENPGRFTGAFYFFHLDSLDDQDEGTASGHAIDRKLIKGMSGISILRDGFRVRSQGDWLDLSAGMTSGSTYNMRVDNTVGYFALTGEENFRLIEKSDREGFVEDAAYRGFFSIARACRRFANEALEQSRRALDDYARTVILPKGAPVAQTTEGSLKVVEDNLKTAKEAKDTAESIAAKLLTEIEKLESSSDDQTPQRVTTAALRIANNAIRAVDDLKTKLTTGTFPELDLRRLKRDIEDRNEQSISLVESAAVGLSARGLAHELRTHLTEIRQRTAAIEKASKKSSAPDDLLPNLRAIRGACNAISNAMSLIDPMLPKSRSLKETIDLRDFVEKFIQSRMSTLDSLGIKPVISGAGRTVRANRGRLTQVIDNLFRNSVYWVRQVPESKDKPRRITFTLTENGFNISDTGPGVDERFEDSLFEIFVSGKPSRDGGQGLGLFITQELLHLDGCDIELLGGRNDNGRRYKFAVDLGPLIKA